jgi:heptose I phosphotransferase
MMQAELTDRLHRKQGRSIARWTLRGATGDKSVFVKRHYRHPVPQTMRARIEAAGCRSDAAREFRNLADAGRLGVPVPRALACAEWRDRDGLQSALVLEELCGMIPLHQAIPHAAKQLPPRSFRVWKNGLIAEIVRLVQLLHDAGRFHRDLYLCHFYITAADAESTPSAWHGRVTMIDFHRLTRRRVFSLLARAKDLGQLLYSAYVPGIDVRDVARFWRLYRRGSRWPILRRLVRLKARCYRAHNSASK